jgi:dihydropteroate synthase
LPAVEAIVTNAFPDAVISVDTFRAGVAEAAVKAGAHIINDISGRELDADMFATVARLQVPYILMHMKGTPQTMQQLANMMMCLPKCLIILYRRSIS